MEDAAIWEDAAIGVYNNYCVLYSVEEVVEAWHIQASSNSPASSCSTNLSGLVVAMPL